MSQHHTTHNAHFTCLPTCKLACSIDTPILHQCAFTCLVSAGVSAQTAFCVDASAGSHSKDQTTIAAEHGPDTEAPATQQQQPLGAQPSQEGVQGQISDAAQLPSSQQPQEQYRSLTGVSLLLLVACMHLLETMAL